jgi:hypothetical protein
MLRVFSHERPMPVSTDSESVPRASGGKFRRIMLAENKADKAAKAVSEYLARDSEDQANHKAF